MGDNMMSGVLQRQYENRFSPAEHYRNLVWQELCRFFAKKYIPESSTVLDLGCGWGEFINNIPAAKKIGMDLNPAGKERLLPEVEFLQTDCSDVWPVASASLDIIFSSNFLEHLPSKSSVEQTIGEVYRCLKPKGKFICMCPNIKFVHGAYWDFWDHHLPLTDASVVELMSINGFGIDESISRFLPYSMSAGRKPPVFLLRWYLNSPLLWRFWGKQFLIVGVKPC